VCVRDRSLMNAKTGAEFRSSDSCLEVKEKYLFFRGTSSLDNEQLKASAKRTQVAVLTMDDIHTSSKCYGSTELLDSYFIGAKLDTSYVKQLYPSSPGLEDTKRSGSLGQQTL
jgi:hypothetical protein